MIGELALAQALLAGAGLLLVSFVHATRIDLGFASTDRVVAEINLSPAYVQPVRSDGLIDRGRKIRFINNVLDRVRTVPGIRAVAASSTAPLAGAPNRGMRLEGDPVLPPEPQPTADFQLITPDYFRALGMAAAGLLRSAVREADPQQPISRVRSIEAVLSGSMAVRRFNTWIVGLFAATALLLAAIGTYGVMSFAVTSRTRELGVRAALGATPSDLIRMVLRQGVLLTAIAVGIGLAGAVLLTRFMAALLFAVALRDY